METPSMQGRHFGSHGAPTSDLPLIDTFMGQDCSPRESSRNLVERCLSRIAEPNNEGTKVFLAVWQDEARTVSTAVDVLREHGYLASPVAGVPISIKDHIDVAGEVTRAAAQPLDDAPPAPCDAPVVRRLKRAGAVLLGRTNMTPFAYSVVGLNAHFGTPGNPADPRRTPGGSSSGAAISVAAGMAMAAVGSDTVGSIRVPAALCGVVGMKPSQRRVPLDGAVPLSQSLDSIGPLARSVEGCARLLAAMADDMLPPWRRTDAEDLRLAVPNAWLLDGLDATVAHAFAEACRRLRASGARVRNQTFSLLDELRDDRPMRTIQSVEAFAWHEDLLERRGDDYEPRIRARIETGRDVMAPDYARALRRRAALVLAFQAEMSGIDALVLPTVPIVAPTFVECEADEDGVRTRLMRNTAPFNLLDACAVTLPIHEAGQLPVGLMVVAPSGRDWDLLDIAHTIETTLQV